MRIGIGIASLTLSVLFIAQTLGLIPNVPQAVLDGRKALCETVAVECSLAAQRDDLPMIRAAIGALLTRNESVLSAAVRRANGKLLADVGNHQAQWLAEAREHAPGTHVEVPIFQNKQRWGTVEIRFLPVEAAGWQAWIANPALRLITFVTSGGFLLQLWYLKRVLKHLDPSSVIPDRVRATLDTLAEGVLVLNREQRIVLANKAFAETTGRSIEELQGVRADEFNWARPDAAVGTSEFPWQRAISEGVSQTGVMLGLEESADRQRKFTVNTMPILGGDGRRRGALVTFDDVTSIEEKNVQLEGMLQDLQTSRDEIRRQNSELTLLATCDPLTSCLNRRAFFAQFQTQWEAAASSGRPLSCLMVDIDHFKSINDRFGHAAGDAVLQRRWKARTLCKTARSRTTSSAATVARNFASCCPPRRSTRRGAWPRPCAPRSPRSAICPQRSPPASACRPLATAPTSPTNCSTRPTRRSMSPSARAEIESPVGPNFPRTRRAERRNPSRIRRRAKRMATCRFRFMRSLPSRPHSPIATL